MDIEQLKKLAGERAVLQVKSGMRLGLGTGSTTQYAVMAIGELWKAGALKDIVGVPTSVRTEELAKRYAIPLVSIDALDTLDLAIDGADEVDPAGNLIKGGGGALLREKVVEMKARRLVIVVDENKLSPKLGTKFALPVEITQASVAAETAFLTQLGAETSLRGGASPFVTDNGNYILDAKFPSGISDAYALAKQLEARPDVRAHGLFLDMASEVIVAGTEGIRSIDFR